MNKYKEVEADVLRYIFDPDGLKLNLELIDMVTKNKGVNIMKKSIMKEFEDVLIKLNYTKKQIIEIKNALSYTIAFKSKDDINTFIKIISNGVYGKFGDGNGKIN